jgi:hypothetical protein
MKSSILSLLLLALQSLAVAGGSLNMSGKLRSFNSQTIDIEDARKIYSIQRDKLGPDQNKKINQAKAGSEINLQIPFEAMTNVQLKK